MVFDSCEVSRRFAELPTMEQRLQKTEHGVRVWNKGNKGVRLE